MREIKSEKETMMSDNESVKILTYKRLKQLNEDAVRNKRNRSLYFDRLPISQLEIYPIVFALPHNDIEMRCEISLNEHGDAAWLDMPIDEYNRLPTMRELEEMRAGRPCPDQYLSYQKKKGE